MRTDSFRQHFWDEDEAGKCEVIDVGRRWSPCELPTMWSAVARLYRSASVSSGHVGVLDASLRSCLFFHGGRRKGRGSAASNRRFTTGIGGEAQEAAEWLAGRRRSKDEGKHEEIPLAPE